MRKHSWCIFGILVGTLTAVAALLLLGIVIYDSQVVRTSRHNQMLPFASLVCECSHCSKNV